MKRRLTRRRVVSTTLSLLVGALLTCGYAQHSVKLGADVLISDHLDLLKGQRVGLITNHTGRLSTGQFLLDVLLSHGVSVVALFGPEHGVRGEAAAGEKIADTKDLKTGIPVFSLYGAVRKPTLEMLEDVDVLVFDIQDVGARFYTYISTMGLCMEAAAEKGIPFIVLDRPNPLGGMDVDGPIVEDSLKSFVGMFSIPVVYGLTCGELARMVNAEGWLANGVRAELTVIPMKGWKRSMRWTDIEIEWVRPSPNIPYPQTSYVYPATCFIEATNLSEGRGTDRPFNTIGAPFINPVQFSFALSALGLPGVRFMPTSFTPKSSKYSGELCHGVAIEITDPESFEVLRTGLCILNEARRLYPRDFKIIPSAFYRLMGSVSTYDMLINEIPPVAIVASWAHDLEKFSALASQYRLYQGE